MTADTANVHRNRMARYASCAISAMARAINALVRSSSPRLGPISSSRTQVVSPPISAMASRIVTTSWLSRPASAR